MNAVDVLGRAPDPAALHRLDGRVAVITGASSGLGERFARVLAAAGAHVVLGARRAPRLEALAGELGGTPVVCDVTVDAQRRHLITVASTVGGTFDILVNNAGTVNVAPALEETLDDFRHVLEVNLTAIFALSQLAAASMAAAGRGGSIVNIASIYGPVASGNAEPHASYAASKGGVISLTRELAAQWGSHGVRVNALAPGYFPSEISAPALNDDRFLRRVRRATALGRVGRPEELDGPLLFLAGDASSYVTGQVVVVDGGWTAL